MDTLIARVNPLNPEPEIIEKAADILKNGGLVAFPTETVYGLGGNGLDPAACGKIYEAKGRPSDNPLILHISDIGEISRIVREIPPAARACMDAFWPGPLTMVLKKTDAVPDLATGGLDTVAVRFPSNPAARALIKASGLPIAGPSANSSGRPSPTAASHVFHALSGKIDMILDGGECKVGIESTILDVSDKHAVILRPGFVTREMIEAVIGRIEIDASMGHIPDESFIPRAPGMKYTHYSPEAEVILVSGGLSDVVKKINLLACEDEKKGVKTGIMASSQTKELYTCGTVLCVGDRSDIKTVAENLFGTLRRFDELGVSRIYSEVFEEDGCGMAVMNRLSKAAGYKCIKA